MGINDLSLVTKSLINLLDCCFSTAPEQHVHNPVISSHRPDQLKGNAVGLYLYHVCEDPHSKNTPVPDDQTAPVKYSPLGLQLYYQLVAQYLSETESKDSSIYEQNMMGVAMKALHDFAIIDERTKVFRKMPDDSFAETAVFDDLLTGTGTRLRIELLSIDPKDAMSYWATSSTAPRLAAYYKVSVVFLRPEKLPTRTGRVFAYGIGTFAGLGPRIDGCRNTLSFKLPGKTISNQVELSPAQVPFGEEVLFTGTGFNGGSATLLLKHADWVNPLKVDGPWLLSFSQKGAVITIQKTIPDEHGIPVKVLPGIYSAIINVKRQFALTDGTTRAIEQHSNECPFMISPAIVDPGDNVFELPAIPDKTIHVQGHVFPLEQSKDPLFPLLKVYVGDKKLTGIKSAGTLSAGEFKVGDVNNLYLLIPGLLDPDIHYFPLRIIINGAESAPFWIHIP
ncbi:MAG: DUF4255 domain-containing protein [Bacteroidetes bacterium]|nr:DUF4255 domain-containing protein [Bacteroidota bacterium]